MNLLPDPILAALTICIGVLLFSGGARGAAQETRVDPRVQQKRIRKLISTDVKKHGNGDDLQKLIATARPAATVKIPAGCYSVEKSIEIPPGLTVLGAGVEKTIIYRHPGKCLNSKGQIFLIKGQKGSDTAGTTRISGIAFVGITAPDDKGWDYGVNLRNVLDFRLDNCFFDRFGFAGVSAAGKSRGVIDHCLFVDNFKKAINNVGYGVVVMGENVWPKKCVPGSADAVFIEDCQLIGSRHAVASNAGAHYVFRHNLIQGNVNSQAIDAHGMGYGSKCGTRMIEVYRNRIEKPGDRRMAMMIRGGDGLIFENTIKGYKQAIVLCLEFGTPPKLKKSYPARDQIRDMWAWKNTSNGRPVRPTIFHNAKNFIKLDRDYHLKPRPGYQPYTYPHPLTKARP
jgi:hypothetical protein